MDYLFYCVFDIIILFVNFSRLHFVYLQYAIGVIPFEPFNLLFMHPVKLIICVLLLILAGISVFAAFTAPTFYLFGVASCLLFTSAICLLLILKSA